MGRPGIIIQTTHLIQPHNIPGYADSLNDLLSFSFFWLVCGDFVGLPHNITSEHRVKSRQF